eukprot:TRINITY_DN2900_c0_g2_i1.p1 TRINITY_DN2900_c0_g2~~TRINITY_DN2900_c0_g2_i1.p1  ORF type:complete len:468 (-),score=129.48 TRINITY_DN2900_c0_g2_i1:275-1678(-)
MWVMRRYQWSLAKTLQFLTSRRPDLEIRPNFVHQLAAYENRLGPRTSTWNEIAEESVNFENEELLVRNTYLNAQMGPVAVLPGPGVQKPPPKMRWADEMKGRGQLAEVIEEGETVPVSKMAESMKNTVGSPAESAGEPAKSKNSKQPFESKNVYPPANYTEEETSKGSNAKASSHAVTQTKTYSKTLSSQGSNPRAPTPKEDSYADELFKKYLGTANSENPKVPSYADMKEPSFNSVKGIQYESDKYKNASRSNDVKRIQSIKPGQYLDPGASLNKHANSKDQSVNSREQRATSAQVPSDGLKHQRVAQPVNQYDNAKYVREATEVKKYKCTEAKGSQYIDSLHSNMQDKQLKTSDKFSKYIRAMENDAQHMSKSAADTNIVKSINQMLDLNEAMSKKCGLYQDELAGYKDNLTFAQPQKHNYTQVKRPPSAQEPVIKKVVPAKRSNARPSSATVKRDTAIPKLIQR